VTQTNSGGKPLRFGIIGCGVIGPTHAGAFRQIDGVAVVAAADVVPDRARAMGEKFGIERIYANDDELLANPQVDAVCICTPSGLHADGAVRALRAGKHVVIEKPMDVSLEACDRIIAAADQTHRTVTVISQHRFDAASMLVRDAVVSGRLGRIVLATADAKWWRTQAYYDSGDWRGTVALDGGGALMNQGIHTVDVLQWLVGGVRSIFAHTRTAAHERIEVEDVAAAALEFESGAVGTLVASTAAYDGLPVRIDIFGTEGSAIIEGDRLRSMVLKDGTNYASEKAAAHAISVARGGTVSVKDDAVVRAAEAEQGAVWGDAHRAQLEDFVQAIRDNRPPLIDARAGRKPVEIVLAVYESARTGRPVVLGR
jgi:predicted dehydrogenase